MLAFSPPSGRQRHFSLLTLTGAALVGITAQAVQQVVVDLELSDTRNR